MLNARQISFRSLAFVNKRISGCSNNLFFHYPHRHRRSYISLPSSISELSQDILEAIRGQSNEKRKELVVKWKLRSEKFIEARANARSKNRLQRKSQIRGLWEAVKGLSNEKRKTLALQWKLNRIKFVETRNRVNILNRWERKLLFQNVWEAIKIHSNEKRERLVKKWRCKQSKFIEDRTRVRNLNQKQRNLLMLQLQKADKQIKDRMIQARKKIVSSRSKAFLFYTKNLGQILTKGQPGKHETSVIELKIDEAESNWFDRDGFPLTSRNSNGRFVNPWSIEASTPPFQKFIIWRFRRFFDQALLSHLHAPKTSSEEERFLPTVKSAAWKYNIFNIASQFINDPLHMMWIGHSTCFVRMRSKPSKNRNETMFNILTDPVFSEHAAPIQSGVPRFVAPAQTIEMLAEKLYCCGKLDAIVISHDHYDHLDLNSINEIEQRNVLSPSGKYIVPLGHKNYLIDKCNIPEDRVIELQWWQSYDMDKDGSTLSITCAPAQHWCSRTPFDRNKRLWCSYGFHVKQKSSLVSSFYFAGDTGFPENFPLHAQIGERLGPFDLAAIPIGAYKPEWFMKESHCSPEDAILIHSALRAKHSVGIHWGTWALADEPYFEPPLRFREAAEKEGYKIGRDVFVLRHGEAVSVPNKLIKNKDALVPLHPIYNINK